ncbi:dUTP diphosphatase [Paenibacillus sp. Marseille-Q9583]
MLDKLRRGDRRVNAVNVKIKRLHPDAVIPQYATGLAAGFDLVAVEDVVIAPGDTVKVPLGLAFEIPAGYVMIVCMRSGIALKTKLRQPNGIGVIDADYRGEVAMMFDNIAVGHEVPVADDLVFYVNGTGRTARPDEINASYIICKGDRVCQAFIIPYPRVTFEVVTELAESERGACGFGHSGVTSVINGWRKVIEGAGAE